MDIFEHIKKEHREVEGMLRTLSNGYDKKVFDKLKLSLNAHMEAEEGSLYPAMKDQAADMIEHAQGEHDQVREMLGKMGEDSDFTSMVAKLTDAINDHVQEEEQEMFPKAQDMFDQDRIEKLSEKFDQIDERIMERAK